LISIDQPLDRETLNTIRAHEGIGQAETLTFG